MCFLLAKQRIMSSLPFAVLLLLTFSSSLRCDYFTSMVGMEKLLHTEREVIGILEQYLLIEDQRLQKIQRLCTQFKEVQKMVVNNESPFLSNPINNFLLIKRLTRDWEVAKHLTHSADSENFIQHAILHRKDLHFPKDEDLKGAAVALMRLQDTYKLNTTTLANGQIEGTKSSLVMTAGDCYELGMQTYNGDDFDHTLLWMQEALDRLSNEKMKTANRILIMQHMAYSALMQGNSKEEIELSKNIIKAASNHQRALQNLKKHYQQATTEQENTKKMVFDEDKLYERLCRGESVKTQVKEILFCRYFTNDNPVLFLQPVKEEELRLNPRIVVYHDVISEKEIHIMKSLAQPNLERAVVGTDETKSATSKDRTSKSAWLKDEDDDAISRVSQRIEDITGLDMTVAEKLQVGNYGIGGHYSVHYDFFPENCSLKEVHHGDRIATWLNYMSDVDAGGATVFPLLGVRVKPQKGSAAFWYNLLRSGVHDYRTLHAACPVLAGSKWVSNKWIHENKQEFRRRCSLNEFE